MIGMLRIKSENFIKLFGLIFISVNLLLTFLIFPHVAGGTSHTNPTVDSVTIALSSGGGMESEINLTENASTTVFVHGTASDVDGCEDIDAAITPSVWKVVFYRTDVASGNSCTQDRSNCYQDTEQDADITGCTGGGDQDVNYEMDFDIDFYSDATDVGSNPDHSSTNWTGYVEVADDASGTGSNSITTEMNTLKALDVSVSVEYGSLDLGATSSETTVTVMNTGNDDDLDPTIHDTNGWTCTIGTMNPGQVHWNTVESQGYGSGTAVTSSTVDVNNLSIPKSTNGSPSTKSVYTTLKIPATGVGGSCSSTLSFTAS
jgi:hypothetical protein